MYYHPLIHYLYTIHFLTHYILFFFAMGLMFVHNATHSGQKKVKEFSFYISIVLYLLYMTFSIIEAHETGDGLPYPPLALLQLVLEIYLIAYFVLIYDHYFKKLKRKNN